MPNAITAYSIPDRCWPLSIATAHVMVRIDPAATAAEIRRIAADLEAVAKAREGQRNG